LISSHPEPQHSTFFDLPTENLLILLNFRKGDMPRISKRTRSSLADSSAVDDECTGKDDPGTNTTRWQRIFATFLAEASAALASPISIFFSRMDGRACVFLLD
jgi:hypothetical protein